MHDFSERLWNPLRSIFLYGMVVGIFAGVAALLAGLADRPESQLVIPSEVDLGAVALNGQTDGEIKIVNPGDAMVLITTIDSSCGCTGLPSEPIEAPPRQSVQIPFTFVAPHSPAQSRVNVRFFSDRRTIGDVLIRAEAVNPLAKEADRSDRIRIPIAAPYRGLIHSLSAYRSALDDEQIEASLDRDQNFITIERSESDLLSIDFVVALLPDGAKIRQQVRVVDRVE